MTKATYCIIGAGPAGLAVARAFKKANISFEVLEKHSNVGGIWDMSNQDSTMYSTAHFISSKTLSGFPDFPMPDHFPDYPSRTQILEYIQSFAQRYRLYQHIQFNTNVLQVHKITDTEWNVVSADGKTRTYQGVICAPGTNWQPNLPSYEGHFSGDARHSATYRYPAEFNSKRVLIVGGGNAGVDIACDAAEHAQKAFWSIRRGYYIVPKYIFGKPADVFDHEGPRLPMRMTQWIFEKLMNLTVGDLTKLGFPRPDHRILESHPIVNSQILHHAGHGNIAIKPDIKYLDGKQVVFQDGSREDIDLIIYATGYNMPIPYLSPHFIEWKGNRPLQYLGAFTPKQDNLFTVGMLEANSGAYSIFDDIGNMLANYLNDKELRPEKAAAFRKRVETEQFDLTAGLNFVKSNRHANYVDGHVYRATVQKVAKQMGWTMFKPNFYKNI
jgi:cation diffusion facilitator CzcD-associated flavoprotein CzcO